MFMFWPGAWHRGVSVLVRTPGSTCDMAVNVVASFRGLFPWARSFSGCFLPPNHTGVVSEYIGHLNLGAGGCPGLLNVFMHVHCGRFMRAVLMCAIPAFLPYTKKIYLGGEMVCANSSPALCLALGGKMKMS